MADPKKALMLLGSLGVILLILVITFAVTLLIGGKFKEKVCTQDGGTYSAGSCSVNATSEAYNATRDLLTEVKTVIGFVGLVVLGAVGYILVGMARSYMKDGNDGY